MPFSDQPIRNQEVQLVNIDDEITPTKFNEDGTVAVKGTPRDPAIAIFSDKSQMLFPKGVRFTVDNHTDPANQVTQMRMRASIYVDDKPAPVVSVLIPIFCTKQYVEEVIKQLKV